MGKKSEKIIGVMVYLPDWVGSRIDEIMGKQKKRSPFIREAVEEKIDRIDRLSRRRKAKKGDSDGE